MVAFQGTSALFVTEEMKTHYKMMHQKKKLKGEMVMKGRKKGWRQKGLVTLKK